MSQPLVEAKTFLSSDLPSPISTGRCNGEDSRKSRTPENAKRSKPVTPHLQAFFFLEMSKFKHLKMYYHQI